MDFILGESNDDIRIDTTEEYRRITLLLAEQSRKSIDIFSQDLEAEIFNNKSFEAAIFALAKKHATTTIRILVQDSTKPVQNGHRIIRLAQQLTSSVFIHTPAKKYSSEKSAFMVADKIGFINRAVATTRTYKATAIFKAPRPAMKLVNYFDEMWEHSTPDPQTRRIFV